MPVRPEEASMAEDIDGSVLEALRGLLDLTSGTRQLMQAVAARLPSADADEETPEKGAELVGSRLRCILRDNLDPAIQSLQSLIEETTRA